MQSGWSPHSSQFPLLSRTALEVRGFYNNAYRIVKLQNDCFALPLTQPGNKHFMDLTSGQHPLPDPFEGCRLLPGVQFPPSKKELAKAYSEYELLHKDMERFLSRFDLSAREKGELLSDLPTSWERHGDLIVLPNTAFTRAKWSQLSSPAKDGDSPPQAPLVPNGHIWKTVASALKCNRLAIYNRVKSDKFRSSGTTLLLGKDGWVEHTDNGIKYVFDVTKVMFSSGNITEKLRIASFNCKGRNSSGSVCRDRVLHSALPGTRTGQDGSCLWVEFPRCGGPGEESGGKRSEREVYDPLWRQQKGIDDES